MPGILLHGSLTVNFLTLAPQTPSSLVAFDGYTKYTLSQTALGESALFMV